MVRMRGHRSLLIGGWGRGGLRWVGHRILPRSAPRRPPHGGPTRPAPLGACPPASHRRRHEQHGDALETCRFFWQFLLPWTLGTKGIFSRSAPMQLCQLSLMPPPTDGPGSKPPPQQSLARSVRRNKPASQPHHQFPNQVLFLIICHI